MRQKLSTGIGSGYIPKRAWLVISIVLFVLSFLIANYFAYNATPESVAKTLEKSIRKKENLFLSTLRDSVTLHNITIKTDSISNRSNLSLDRLTIGIFAYRLNDIGHPLLVHWNSSSMDPDTRLLSSPDGAYAANSNKGFFEQITKTVRLGTDTFKVVGVIPVYWQYLQSSSLFTSHFDGYPDLGSNYVIANHGVSVHNGEGKILFHIARNADNTIAQSDNFSLVLKLVAISIWMLLFNDFVRRFAFRHGFFAGLALLVSVLATARLLSYYYPFPFNFRVYELFDPLIYASSWIHRSLGDLLINLFLLLWVSSFIKKNLGLIRMSPLVHRLWKYKLVFALLGLLLQTVFTILFVRILETLVSDSQISFNVTNFFSMNVYTVVCIVALAFFMWSYVRITYLLLLPSVKAGFSLLTRMVIILAIGVLFSTFFSNADHILSDCITVLWLVLFVFIYDLCWDRLTNYFVASPDFLVLVVFLSASFTAVIYTEYRQLEWKDRKFFAENLAMRSDETGEVLIRIAINNINSLFLQKGVDDLLSEDKNIALKYRLVNENFSGYLSRYSTSIYTFDSARQPLFNSDSVHFETLQNNIQMLAKNTDMPDLYYNNTNPDQFSYIYRKKLRSPDSLHSVYLFILIKPLRYSDNQLDVRLFNASKALPGDLDNDYSYAIYYNRKLVSRHLNDNYSSVLDDKLIPKGEYMLINNASNSILVYNAGDNKVIIVTNKMNVWLDILTLFAYIFCSAIVVLSLSYFFMHLFFSGFNIRYLKQVMRLTINRRLQGTIIFLSLFSFMVVGISTITFSLAQFRETSKIKLSKSAKIIEDETQNSIKNDLFMDVSDTRAAEENYPKDAFARKVLQIAELNDVDINYYNLDGTLEATTQPTIYGHGFFNSLMNPRAFYMLRNKEQMEYTQDENIGSFKFSSIYFPLQDLQGNDIAYINIPYLNSQNEARLQISQFLVTVIDLNALIFIFAGFMALRFTRKITSTFEILADKMRVINLTGKNEPLVYKRKDEIGALVRGYNSMLEKLSQSAEALARSERQGAWQEMARQIAHEIKNPLTPMKLSIQYLDRAIASGAPNAADLSKRVTQTLIEQIDQLAQIAGDFSQFANINNVVPARMDLRDNLKSLVQLYGTDNGLEVSLDIPDYPVCIIGDKSQINRLFTNLIKNAIEASDNNKKKAIYIALNLQDGQAVVSLRDEGAGIPDEMKDKIFVPNFTTKSSGTGLGLAICKGICERAGGAIWFESVVGEGTTFFVSIPAIMTDESENKG